MSADELKAKGNAAFSAGAFEDAVTHFTAAIELAPENHVLYSNRSAAQASLHRYQEALEDAKKVTSLKKDWPKGYSRLGAALFGLGRFAEAEAAYSSGLEVDPGNAQLQEGASEAAKAAASARSARRAGPGGGASGLGSLFTQPEVLGRLAADPRTRTLLGQPDFAQLLREIDADPQALARFQNDDRLKLALEVGLGLGLQSDSDGWKAADEAAAEARAEASAGGEGATGSGGGESEPEPAVEVDPEEAAAREAAAKEAAAQEAAKAEGERLKKLGNDAYKSRDFPTAVQRYTEALEAFDGDATYLSNRAAAHFEAGDYAACVADCDEAVARGRELRADYKVIARALTRKGNALAKAGDLAGAIETYQKSLTEHRNADTLKRLQDAERAKKEGDARAYVDLAKADEAREKGNEAFRAQKYPEAVAFYTEAIKRGPAGEYADHHKLLSNRAACYTKLGAWNEGLKDADRCIELAPDFAKGYSRKGHLQFFAKEYDKARQTYEAGLARDPGNEELREGLSRTIQAINRFARGGGTEAELKDRQARAMADPEVQAILTDPVMRQVLRDLEENPAEAQKHFLHPEISKKIEKLVSAGIIQIR